MTARPGLGFRAVAGIPSVCFVLLLAVINSMGAEPDNQDLNIAARHLADFAALLEELRAKNPDVMKLYTAGKDSLKAVLLQPDLESITVRLGERGPKYVIEYKLKDSPVLQTKAVSSSEYFTLHLYGRALLNSIDLRTRKVDALRLQREFEGLMSQFAKSASTWDARRSLYETATSLYFEISEVSEEKWKQHVDGFRAGIDIIASLHPEPASLAILLPGLGASRRSKMARLYQSYLYDLGFDVVSIDSPFKPEFFKAAMFGVPGNLREEAVAVCRVVRSILSEARFARRWGTDFVVVGISYGGLIGLHFAVTWDSERASVSNGCRKVVALSPPVNMKASADILDGFESVRRAKFGGFSFDDKRAGLASERPSPLGPLSYDEDTLKAAIATYFKNDFVRIVVDSDRIFFKSGKLIQRHPWGQEGGVGEDLERLVVAEETWSYSGFISQMTGPHWGLDADALWDMGRVKMLLRKLGPRAMVVLARNDPWNQAGDLSELVSSDVSPSVRVLPDGGHMGYSGDREGMESLLKEALK